MEVCIYGGPEEIDCEGMTVKLFKTVGRFNDLQQKNLERLGSLSCMSRSLIVESEERDESV